MQKRAKNKKKVEKNRDFSSNGSGILEEFASKINEYSQKYDIPSKDVLDLIIQNKISDIQKEHLPISIFNNKKLSILEIIVKYLKENKNLKTSKIAKNLNRNPGAISVTYSNAIKKDSNPIENTDSNIFIPIDIFAKRDLSVLETIVVFLHKKRDMKPKEIAKALNKNVQTIYTALRRAKEKNE